MQVHYEIQDEPIMLASTFDVLSHDPSCGHSLWKQRADATKYNETSRILDAVMYMQLPTELVVINLPLEYRENL